MSELELEDLVLRHFKNVTKVSDGDKQYAGHVDGDQQYKAFVTDLNALGFSFYSRSSRTNKSSRILFTCEAKNADISIPFFGSPFQIVKSTYLSCSQDARYESRPTKHLLTDQPSLKKTRMAQPSKKIGCPAFMTVKCLRVFDESCYKLNVPYKENCSIKRKILKTLSKDLLTVSPPSGTLRFMIIMSPAKEHTHTVEYTNLNQRLHPKLIHEIHDFAKRNICSVKTMKDHLKEVVENMFENGASPQPDKLNRCYYPNDQIIRFHLNKALFTIKKSWYDQEALEHCLNAWKRDYPEDNFSFRPYTATNKSEDEIRLKEELPSSTLLFCHQTKWQRGLLSRYGNDICLLDTTYKTCNYNFPLFFIVIKTNSGHCVVGTFVVQSELSILMGEALSQFRTWNPEWDPKYFLTDYSEAEIHALEQTFPQSTVYVSTFHREREWNSWLNKKGNVTKEARAPLETLWQDIAASHTEEEYIENVQEMYDSESYQQNACAMEYYFCKGWLQIHQKWVNAYCTNDFLFNVNINNGIDCQRETLTHPCLTQAKEKTLSGIIRVILEDFLPGIIQKYSANNSPLESREYIDAVPEFLRTKPILFIESVMLWFESGKEYDATQINEMGDGLFVVKTNLNSEDWCSVDFQEASCSCPDFSRWRLPCIHMCAIFVSTDWSFDKLPLWYRENPYITIDTNYSDDVYEVNLQCAMLISDAEDQLGLDMMGISQYEESMSEEYSTTDEKDVNNMWEKTRERLKMIIDYTYLQHDPDNILKFSNSIKTLEEEMLLSASKSDSDTGLLLAQTGNISIEMKKIIPTDLIKKKYLHLPLRSKLKIKEKTGRQFQSSPNFWHEYTAENVDFAHSQEIDQIVVIDMM